MTAVRVRNTHKLVRTLGLMASASVMSMLIASEAQAQCVASPAQPLNNITTPVTAVTCTGANTGQTITANANAVEVYVIQAGATLDNSTVTLNGDANVLTIGSGRSAANLIYSSTGNVSGLEISGSATNLRATANGLQNNIGILFGGTVTAAPGNISLSAGSGQVQSFAMAQGTSLTSTGNAGGAYLLTGGTGNQTFDLAGTVALQGNGLFINAGDGDDTILIETTAIFSNGNVHTINGGTGNDRLILNGSGNTGFATTGVERLDVLAGVGGTRTLNENGSFTQVNLLSGTLSARRAQALGAATSLVTLSSGTILSLDFTAPAVVNNSFAGSGTIRQNTIDPVTYGGSSAGFSGNVDIGGGVATILTSDAFGSGSIFNSSTIIFGDFNLANNISGTGGINKVGPGIGSLTGDNSGFSGTINVDGGTLVVNSANALGTGTVQAFNTPSILQFDMTSDSSLSAFLDGDLSVVKNGSGILDLTIANGYTGGTTINAGAIRVSDFNAFGTGAVTANAGASVILNYNASGQLLQTTPFMTGDGSFIKEGSGDVVMSQTSTYTGGTIIRAGRIGLNNGAALGTGNIQIDSGAELGVGGITLNNNLTGSGLVRKTASNLVELYGDNRGFTGTIQVQDGVLFANNGNALGSGILQIDSGTSVQLGAVNDSTVAADLAGSGLFEKLGGGLVTMTGDGSQFTGGIAVTGGILEIEGSQNIGNSSTVSIGSAGALQLNTAGSTQLFNSLSGAGALIKTGTGTVFLTGNNTHSGGTDIQQGAIRVSDLAALGTGPVSVQFGAALDLSISGSATYNGAISGAGILRKSDTGDLTLISNTLTGGLDIVGGRVIVGTTAALGSGPVTTAADTQLVFTNSTTELSNTLISGAGTVTMAGTGLLVMNNANSYTGGTIINSGRVGLNDGMGLGTGSIIVFQNAILGIGGVAVANNISGAGQVIKTGSNTADLTGNNSYSGGTDIQQGALRVNSPAALGTGGVTMASGAFLQLNYNSATNAALNNILSGAGFLVKDGTGTIIVNASNSFTGGTIINGGRLGLNFGDALGTGMVVINAGASLALGDLTYANATSGAGQIVKTSAGVTTLTGTNTHSGGVDIQNGIVDVTGNGALGTGTVSIANGANLRYTNATAATFTNALSGMGTFNKLGAGQLTFANNFTLGALSLQAGRTRINSVATTNVTVGTGATLDGTGRIIGSLTNNGTVAPGNSIGTLTVQGNYTHNANSVLEIEFDGAGNIDLLDVTGNAMLNGGTLRFVSIGGVEGNGGTFLRTGGTLTGTFATVETVGAQLPLAVIYQPNAGIMAPSVLTARPSTFNAQSLAAADTTLGFVETLGFADGRHGYGNRIWFDGFGARGSRSASGTTLSYDHDSHGFAGGANFAVGGDVTLGVAVGWSDGDIALGSGGGGGEQSSLLGAIHARYVSEGVTIGGGVAYGQVDQDTLRNVSFNGFSASVEGATESDMLAVFGGVALPLGRAGTWMFDTSARAAYVRQSQDGYTESGASPLRLTLDTIDTSTFEGEALLSARTSLWDRNNGGEESPEGLVLSVDLGARYLAALGSREIPVTFAASSAGITLLGDTRDAVQGVAGIGLAYTTREVMTVGIGYRAEIGRTDRHSVNVGLSFRF
jgi:autotransporter-associated beta strand protein